MRVCVYKKYRKYDYVCVCVWVCVCKEFRTLLNIPMCVCVCVYKEKKIYLCMYIYKNI